MNNESLKRVEVMKNLGVIFSSNLKYDDYLNYIINKAKKKLGFIIRSTHEFKGPHTIFFKSLQSSSNRGYFRPSHGAKRYEWVEVFVVS